MQKVGIWKRSRLVLFAVNLILGLAFISVPLAQYLDAESYIKEHAEFQPPEIAITTWQWNKNKQELTFRTDISELGNKYYRVDDKEIASRIMDFGIIIIKKNPNGDLGTPVNPVGRDPLTEKDYWFTISFVGLIQTPATIIFGPGPPAQWGGEDGVYVINRSGVVGSGWLVRTDDRHAYVSGAIRFDDWASGTYYIIVWAVDEWGNARWVCYEVNANPSVNVAWISTSNAPGNYDPEYLDTTNYYYTVSREIRFYYRGEWRNFSVFSPYTVSSLSPPVYSKGFQVTLPGSATIHVGGEKIVCLDGSAWGYYTFRIRELAELGSLSIDNVTFHFYAEPIILFACWLYVDLVIVLVLFLAFLVVLSRVEEGRCG